MAIEKWIDLSGLPRVPNRGNYISWKGSIGHIIPFKYKNIIGEFEILDYKNKKEVIIKYKEKIINIQSTEIKKCSLKKLIKPIVFTKEKPNNITKNKFTQWMIQYFQGGYDEAKLYTPCSNQQIDFKCPYCGKIKNTKISTLYNNHGIGCGCGDGISYPNKFIYSILNQCNVDYKLEKKFNWSNNKRYDVYIKKISLIIENHGGQHYIKNGFEYMGGRTLKEEQENDKFKKEVALQNGIKYYIELDCRKSELEWIKDSVMNSKLPNLLNFKEEDIDWLACERYALKNIVKEVCEYQTNNSQLLINEIAKKFDLNTETIRNYLKKGNKLGWCNYIVKSKPNNPQVLLGTYNKKLSKKILCVENDMIFCGAREIVEKGNEIFKSQMYLKSIWKCCSGELNSYKGYHFKYITEEEYQSKIS